MTNDVPELADQAIEQIDAYGYGEFVILDPVTGRVIFCSRVQSLVRIQQAGHCTYFEGLLSISQFQVSELALSAFELFSDHENSTLQIAFLQLLVGSRNQQL